MTRRERARASTADPAGLVLAAGRSSRMEEGFKLLLPWGDGTVVGASVRKGLEAGLGPVVVVTGHRAEEVEEALEAEGVLEPTGAGGGGRVSVVRYPGYRGGQAGSLARGLRALRSTGAAAAAVLLADEPGMSPEAVRRVADAWREEPGAIARALYEDRPGHPVVFPRERFRQLESFRGDRGARSYLARHPDAVRRVRLQCRAPVGIDTRADYERARREG